jgi:hypothetical protein
VVACVKWRPERCPTYVVDTSKAAAYPYGCGFTTKAVICSSVPCTKGVETRDGSMSVAGDHVEYCRHLTLSNQSLPAKRSVL